MINTPERINSCINILKNMVHKTLTVSEYFIEILKRITVPLRKKRLSEFAGKLDDEDFEKAALDVRHSGS